jgi:hypothetical protein
MSLLDRVEDYLIKATLPARLRPIGQPPPDDGIWLLAIWGLIILGAAATCGHILAH